MSEADRALVTALQPDPDVDLVELFGDSGAWEQFEAAVGDVFEPEFVCVEET